MGRLPACEISIDDATFSATNFRLILDEEETSIEDLESTNGTFVNGARMRGKKRLDSPALVRAGDNLFVFHKASDQLLESVPRKSFTDSGKRFPALNIHLTASLPLMRRYETL